MLALQRPPDKSDHLKIADTQFQSLQFADSNVRTAFLKMRPPETCELRTPKVGPKRRFNLRKATTYVKLSEKALVCLSNFSFVGTPNERSSRLQPLLLMVVSNYARGSHQSLMSWLAQGHVYNSILKIFEPNLANETTWKIGPLTPSPFGGCNSQVWLYKHIF